MVNRSVKSKVYCVFIAVLLGMLLSVGAIFATAADGDTPASTANIKLARVEVTQNSGWVVTDGTKSLNSAEIWSKMFTVKVTYAKKTTVTAEDGTTSDIWTDEEPVTLEYSNFSGRNATAQTGEQVVFSFENAGKLTVTVTPKTGAIVDPEDATVTTLDGELAYRTGTRSENGIWARYDGNAQNLTTSSAIPSDNILVYYTYNDGTKEEGSPVSPSFYNFSGNLFPNDFKKTYTANESTIAQVTIMLKAGELSQIVGEGRSTTVQITNVKYVQPTTVTGVDVPDTLVTQVARSEFDYSGISVKIRCGGRALTVPIDTFKNHPDFNTIVHNKYYDSWDDTWDETEKSNHEVSTLSLQAHFVVITFTYPGTAISATMDYASEITVAPIAIATPTFTYYEKEITTDDGAKLVKIDYTKDLSVTPTLPDYGQYKNNGGEPVVTFAISSNATGEDKGYTVGGDATAPQYTFSRPATFTITATLGSATVANEDFVWGLPTGGGDRGENKTNSKVLTYTLQIDKSKLDLDIDTGTAKLEYTYGTTPSPKSSITATEKVSGTATKEPFAKGDFTSDNDDTVNLFRYEFFNELTEDGKVPDERRLTMPTTVGHYYAVAVTKENLYYLSAVSEPLIVTVNPKEIKATNDTDGIFIKPTYKRGDSYGKDDILKAGINTSVGVGGENVGISVTKLNGSATEKVTYWQSGGYDVELAMTNPNYVWAGSDWKSDETWLNTETLAGADSLDKYRTLSGENSAKFVIEKRTIVYTVTASDFYYGQVKSSYHSGSYNATESGILADDKTITANVTYNTSLGTDLSKWTVNAAGSPYTVTYTPQYNSSNAPSSVDATKEKASLTLQPASADLNVKKAQIQKITNNGALLTFKEDGNVVTCNNWITIQNGGKGTHADIQSLLTRTVKFLRDETGATETAFSPELSGENKEKIKLTDAGTYTATIALADTANFEWVGSTAGNSDQADITLTWTVERADVQYQFSAAGVTPEDWKQNVKSATKDYVGSKAGEAQPLPKFRFLDQNGSELTNSYVIAVAPDKQGTTDGTAITAVGEYTFTFTLDASVKNYKIDTGFTTFAYTITEQGIARITTKTLAETFSGETFDFTTYVTVPEGKTYADVYEGRVGIKITAKNGTAEVALRDAGTYTVTVTLADGFKWADGAGDPQTAFEFTVNKLAVEYSWGKDEADKTANLTATYDGETHAPVVTFTNNKDGDAASLTVTVGGAANKTNAGEYAIRLTLAGDKKDNYELKEAAQPTDKYTIYKQVVAKPVKGDDVTYNGAAQTVQYKNGGEWRDLTNIATAEIEGKNANSETVNGTFDLTNGQLSVTHAGNYTVVFTLSDASNYCWDESKKSDWGDTNAALDAITTTVDRLTVKAPKMNRAAEWTEGEQLLPKTDNAADITGKVKYGDYTVTYTYAYGKLESGNWNDLTVNPPVGSDTNKRGDVFYVKITATGIEGKEAADFNAYDILWSLNTDDTNFGLLSTAGIVTSKYETPFDTLYLTYTITGQVVQIDAEFADFTFGDNGYNKGTEETTYEIRDDLRVNGETAKSPITFSGGDLNNTTIFNSASHTVEVKFYTVYTDALKTEYTDLVNGMPWEVGTYTAVITVKFTTPEGADKAPYEDKPIVKPFVISAREIEVVWDQTDGADRKEYNGSAQTRKATIVNVYTKTSGATPAEMELTTESITNVVWNEAGTAAAVQKIDVTQDFTQDGYTNYTYETGTQKGDLTITPVELTVTGKTDVTRTYGETLLDNSYNGTGGTTYFTYSGHLYEHGAVTVKVVVDGTAYALGDSALARLNVIDGGYAVRFELANKRGNFTLATASTDGKLTIEKRAVTVTVKSGLSKVYGNKLDLNDGTYAEVTSDQKLPQGVSVKNILTISATGISTSNYPTVGEYTLLHTSTEVGAQNYTITFVNDNKLQVTNASFAVTASGYAGTYDATEHAVIASRAVSSSNPLKGDVQASTVTWHIATMQDGEYAPYFAADGTTVAEDWLRKDAGAYTYWVKAKAANHNDSEPVKITVTIAKKQLSVSMALTIYYTEAAPNGNTFKTSSDDLISGTSLTHGDTQYNMYTIGGFAGSEGVADLTDLSGTFTYSVVNFTGAVGDYTLRFVPNNLQSKNYTFGDGNIDTVNGLHVVALPLTVTVTNETIAYTESLTADGKANALAHTVATPDSVYGGKVAEPSNVFTLDSIAFIADGEDYRTNKAGGYAVTYAFATGANNTATNYTVLLGGQQMTVQKATAENAFVKGFALSNDKQSTSETEDYAWEYGASGTPTVKEALQFTYIRDNDAISFNQVQVTLYRKSGNDYTQVRNFTVAATDGAYDIAQLLADIDELAAGTYKVHIVLPETVNYNKAEGTWYFAVKTAALTVTAVDASVTYGNDIEQATAPANGGVLGKFAYTVSGLQNGDELADVLTLSISCTYAKGYEKGSVGTYAITVSKTDGDKASSYEIVLNNGTLTVTPRPITVKVDDKQSFYRFIRLLDNQVEGNDYQKDAPETLTYTLTGTLGDGDSEADIFGLATDAHDGNTTQSVGEYSIYLTATKDGKYYSKLDGMTPNYAITIEGTKTDIAVSGALFALGGKYTIVPANLITSISPTNNAPLYNGRQQVYDIAINTGNSGIDTSDLKFDATYFTREGNVKGTQLDEAPTDVGDYLVEFALNNANYKARTSSLPFSIKPVTLYIGAGVWTHENQSVQTVTGGFVYDGGWHKNTFAFTGTVNNETVGLTVTPNHSLHAAQTGLAGITAAHLAFAYDLTNNTFAYTVTNAGKYSFTLALADNVATGFKAANYVLATNTQTTYNDTIAMAQLDVVTNATTVQYGSLLSETVRFEGFTVTYSVHQNSNGSALLASDSTKGYLKFNDGTPWASDNTEKIEYTTDYAPKTSKIGGQYTLQLDKNCIVAYNFVVTPSGVNALTVVKRNVTITVSGYGDGNTQAKTVYKGQSYAHHNADLQNTLSGNRGAFLAVKEGGINSTQQPSDYKDPLSAVSLTIQSTARNAGDHRMAPAATSDLYKITFENTKNETIVNNFENTENYGRLPTYHIEKASLKIAIGQYQTDTVSYAALKKDFTVPYGAALSITGASPTFMVRYDGWVDNEGNDFENKNAQMTVNAATWQFVFVGAEYAQWKSEYGAKFTVKARCVNGTTGEELQYLNYTITYEQATVTVGKLQVKATVENWTYTEKTSGGNKLYNGGVSGIGHYVKPSFTYADGSALPADIAAQLNTEIIANRLYTVSYNTTTANADTAQGAPTKAGTYTATLAFTSQNYEFVTNGNVFTYTVHKQTIDVKWAESGLLVTGEVTKVTNTVANFVNALMEYPVFTRDTTDIRNLDGIRYTDSGLTIETGIAGSYALTLQFNGNAAVNYCWGYEGSDPTKPIGGQVQLMFRVDSSDLSVDFTVSINGWTYGDVANDPTFTLRAHLSGEAIQNPAVTYAYAVASNISQPTEGAYTGDTSGLTFGVTPVNAGWYIVRARFAGNAQYWGADAYYLFRIDQKSVGLPTIEGATNLMYDGMQKTVIASFDRDELSVREFAYTWSYTGTGAQLQVTDAGTYTVTFALNNTLTVSNYKWATDIIYENGFLSAGGNVTYTWTVAKANNNGIVWEGELADKNTLSVTYGESYTISARATYSDAVTLYYAAKGKHNGYADITEWTTQRPSNANTYYVKAVCVGNKNYGDAEDAKILQIDKAILTATPYGSVVYGEDLPNDHTWKAEGNSSFGYQLSGFVNGNTGDTVTADKEKIYYIADITGELTAGETFTLTMKASTSVTVGGTSYFTVDGITSPNYVIVAANGTLTVAKKSVTVQIGNMSAPYLTPITATTLDIVSLRPVGTAWAPVEDLRELLGVTLSTDVTNSSNVGKYDIVCNIYTNTNYDVTFVHGTYEITPLTVYAEWNGGRGGEYGGTITGAAVERVYYLIGGNQNTLENVPTFTYSYSGAAYDGLPYSDMPTHAGRYTVTAIMAQEGSNYVLDAASAITDFTVDKQTYVVDLDNLKAEYTGGSLYLTDATKKEWRDGLGTVFDFADGQNIAHTEVGFYTYTFVLKDANNMQWAGFSTAERPVTFEITKATFKPSTELKIEDWTFGGNAATPTITVPGVNAEDIRFEYATERDGEYTTGVPTNAGSYYVRVYIEESGNYARFVSDPVPFEILPKTLETPAMELYDKDTADVKANTVYTGEQLRAEITGIDGEQVRILRTSDGCQVLYENGKMYLAATNAGTYSITFKVMNSNYAWANTAQAKALYTARDGEAKEDEKNPTVTINEDGTLTLTWRVARKAVKKPVHNGKKYMVKGSVLTFIPDGFDADIMEITKNKAGYGGTYYPTVTLKDTQNYMWDDGTDSAVVLKWRVTGVNTLFAIIMGSIGGFGGALLISAAVMYVLYRKKNKANAPEGDDGNGGDGDKETKADTQAENAQEVAA